ncbi:MAG: DUF1592 domain-containing protein [Chthonomonadales bacterium]
MSGKSLNHLVVTGVSAAVLTFAGSMSWSGAARPQSTDAIRKGLEARFATVVQPFLKSYCVSCHGKDKPQAQLDLTRYTGIASVTRDISHWSLLLERVAANQMPPDGIPKRPTPNVRTAVVTWIRDVKEYEANRTAGDPGPVLAHRLSNSEYDYTIRDLTGADLHPTKEFPVDPANQEGFDNSGESLTLSPALIKKYTQAARDISNCAALTSRGIEFAAHPVLAETDRDKYCILRIVDFYRKQPTDLADYFYAAWRYRNRELLGMPNASLSAIAAGQHVSAKYLDTIWSTLTFPAGKVGPVATLQETWNALPKQGPGVDDSVRVKCNALRDWTAATRKKVAWHFDNLKVPGGFSNGGQVFVLWKDREYASHRRSLSPSTLQIGGVPPTKTIPARRNMPAKTVTDPADADLAVPTDEAERAPYIKSFEKFCSVFPDAFYIAERGRMFVDDPGDKGRLLTAGLHNSMGYFRDDTPLMELLLDANGQKELDRMWLDFDMVAFIPERMHSEFFVYERAESATITDPEFNFARAEDKEALTDPKIKLLGELYLAKAKRRGGDAMALKAIEDHFKWVSTNIRWVERARLAAEPLHLQSLVDFARRAYRRPLTAAEKSDVLGFYSTLRKSEGLTHEDAIRDSVAKILMSPKFLFILKDGYGSEAKGSSRGIKTASLVQHKVPQTSGDSVQPLSDYALASRLSYFLWSSMPDDALLSHAAANDLHNPEVLLAQAHRMLKDPRSQALSVEFGGNWLDFRRFEELNSVDRDRFPTFDNNLREAMYQEPVRFLNDMIQGDHSVLDMLFGKQTFVNRALAKHYNIVASFNKPNDWIRIDDATRYGRGGLLPMAAFLTKNSPGLRTSPVKRGYWVVKRVLGEMIPPPPAVVPELPKDESKMGDLTLRQALAKHRENPACAGCHARFDSYGLVFEGYGPTGELRSKDLGGRLVDMKAPFPGGTERTGVRGLQDFILQRRQQDFLDTFGHKLLSYALGRGLQLSDDMTLRQIQKNLVANGYRFGTMVDTIVTSKQFRNRRVAATLARN